MTEANIWEFICAEIGTGLPNWLLTDECGGKTVLSDSAQLRIENKKKGKWVLLHLIVGEWKQKSV